jgi:hypothetical protein
LSIRARFNGDADKIRQHLLAHTKSELIREFGVARTTPDKWEEHFGVKCRQECFACRQVWDYVDMQRTRQGRLHSPPICAACYARKQSKFQRRDSSNRLDFVEFESTPQLFWQLTRRPISAATGRVFYLPQGMNDEHV